MKKTNKKITAAVSKALRESESASMLELLEDRVMMSTTIASAESGVAANTAGVTLAGTVTAVLTQPGTFTAVSGLTRSYTASSTAFLINDGTGSAEIYGAMPSGSTFAPTVGTRISATGTWSPYNGLPELETLTAISSIGTGTVPTPLTLSSIGTLGTGVNLNSTTESSNGSLPNGVAGYPLTLQDVTIGGAAFSTSFATSTKTGTVTDSSGNSISLYYTYSLASAFSDLAGTTAPTTPVNLTGFLQEYSGNPEFELISIGAPTVTSVTANAGNTGGTAGGSVTINGYGFTNETAVDFGSTPATNVTLVNDQTITATAPAVSAPTTVDVTVANNNGTSTTAPADQYTYSAYSISTAESSVPLDTTGITLNGTITAILEGTASTVTSAGGDSKAFTSTSEFLINDGTGSAEIYGKYASTFTPTIGSDITVTGEWEPYEGVPELSISTASPIATVSTGNPLPAPVTLSAGSNPVGTLNTDATNLTANGSAPENVAGYPITIQGVTISGFTATTFGTSSAFGTITDSGSNSMELYYSSSYIDGFSDLAGTTIPTGPVNLTGIYSVYEGTPELTLLSVGAPTLASVTPNAATIAGAPVVIKGFGFTTETAIDIGTLPATNVTVINDQTIDATAPAVSTPQTVDVTVNNNNGFSAASANDQYDYTSAPTVTGITPADGSPNGGTTVVISGANLAGTTAVYFGSTAATTFTVNTGTTTTISATAPSGTAGTDVGVYVVNAGGTSSTLTTSSDEFLYDAAPTITSLSTSSGIDSGGNTITITGGNFVTDSTVTFGSVTATSSIDVSPTEITAVVPAGTGTANVTVTTAGGSSNTEPYTYSTASIAAVEASATTGQTLTIGAETTAVITQILAVPTTVTGTENGQTFSKSFTEYAFLVNDGTGSADLFYSGASLPGTTYTPVVGDAVTATGTWSPYSGIPEVDIISISKVSSGNTVPAPAVSSITALNTLTNGNVAQSLSGELVTLNDVTISGFVGDWGTEGASPNVTDSSGNTMATYYWPTSFPNVLANLGSEQAPTIDGGADSGDPAGPVNIVGIDSTYDGTAQFVPFTITYAGINPGSVTFTPPASGPFNGNNFTATGGAITPGTAGPDSPDASHFGYEYYTGSSVTTEGDLGTAAPSTPGTYTVVANFLGDSTYDPASSTAATFTIAAAAPTIDLTAPASGMANGQPFTATATIAGVVAGVDNTPSSSLEDTPVAVNYITGRTTSSTAPTTAGTYTVVASYAGSNENDGYNDYAAASTSATFTIGSLFITPSTTAISPTATSIVINGSGFNTNRADDTVTFSNGTTGVVASATASSLTVTLAHVTGGDLDATVKVVTGSGASATTASTGSTEVAVVTPTITSYTTSTSPTVTTLTIHGSGFSTTPADDVVTFTTPSGATVTGTVSTAAATSLTLTGVSGLTGGYLKATVAVNGVSSALTQIASITPTITAATANPISAHAATLTINGHGFDSITPGNNVVTLAGFTGTATVTAVNATGTSMTVSLSGVPLPAGVLKATVSVDGSAASVSEEVATVAPVVTTASTALTASGTTAQTLTINGYGFNATGTTVVLTGATAGHVTVVSPTEIQVPVTNLTGGPVTAVVTSDGQKSGTALEVATVKPAITESNSSIAATATSVVIHGLGFSTTKTLDMVVLNGVTYTPTSASATSLTLTGLSDLPAGALDAVVTVNGDSSSSTEIGNVA